MNQDLNHIREATSATVADDLIIIFQFSRLNEIICKIHLVLNGAQKQSVLTYVLFSSKLLYISLHYVNHVGSSGVYTRGIFNGISLKTCHQSRFFSIIMLMRQAIVTSGIDHCLAVLVFLPVLV